MFDLFLSAAYAPFTFALALLIGLLTLEILFALIGLSMMGEGPDLDMDGADLPDVADLADLGVVVDMPDVGDYDIPDMAAEAEVDLDAGDPGALGWLGLGRVPFMIWFAALLLGFGIFGIVVQGVVANLITFTLPVMLLAPVAFIVGLWFARSFGAMFAAILPKTETTSVSTRRYGGHKGVVTQGTSRRGHPAEVRLTDRHGNFHYLRAEPAKDDDHIKSGTEVVILRNVRTGQMRLIPLG